MMPEQSHDITYVGINMDIGDLDLQSGILLGLAAGDRIGGPVRMAVRLA
jgi:hypothetical protein